MGLLRSPKICMRSGLYIWFLLIYLAWSSVIAEIIETTQTDLDTTGIVLPLDTCLCEGPLPLACVRGSL